MKNQQQNNLLWAPWRINYIQGKKTPGCILCKAPKQKNDEKVHIITRAKDAYTMLNTFPYNNGHMMVIPYRHVANLEDLKDQELKEIMSLVKASVKLLKKHLRPQGFNIGINLGKAAGAGIDKHLHVHIVPRWNGDTNFMPAVSKTKVISQSLNELYRVLKS
ncbi:MAG: HIT domain-containing protein [PVC group bacterium]|nr:HIT domain-containing protein [PVC group bacterium]